MRKNNNIAKTKGVFAGALALSLMAGTAYAQGAADLVPQDIRDRGVLTVGSQQTFPPVEYIEADEPGVTGVAAELLTEIGARLGLEIEYVHGEYASLIPGLESGRFDIASGGISDTLEREEQVDFVNYLMLGASILIRAEDAEQYNTIADFCGRTLAMQLGSNTILQALEQANAECEAAGEAQFAIEQLPSVPDARAQLDLGRVDGYLGDTPALAYFIRNAPGNYDMAGDNYVLTPYVTSWAFSKDDTALRDAIHQVAQDMLEDGTYTEILTRWGLEGSALPEITVNLPASERG